MKGINTKREEEMESGRLNRAMKAPIQKRVRKMTTRGHKKMPDGILKRA